MRVKIFCYEHSQNVGNSDFCKGFKKFCKTNNNQCRFPVFTARAAPGENLTFQENLTVFGNKWSYYSSFLGFFTDSKRSFAFCLRIFLQDILLIQTMF